jgi:hypothetical protein
MNEENKASTGTDKPLVDWKNPPSLADLKQNQTDSRSSHDAQTSKIGIWLDNLNVEGAAKIKTHPGNSSMVPKLIRKQAEWRYSSLSEPFLSTEDLFNVQPVTHEDRKGAQQNQVMLNHQMNVQIDKTHFVDEYVRAAVDEGTVIVRVGWEFEEEEYDEEVPLVQFQVNPEFAQILEQVGQLKQSSPSEYDTDIPQELKEALDKSTQDGIAYEPIITGYETRKAMRTVQNRPTLEVCDYRNVTFDPTCYGVVDKAEFVIYSFESSLSELRKDKKYKNLDKIQASTASVLAQPDHATREESSFSFVDKPRQKFVVYEYWGKWDINKDGKTVPFIAAWVGDTIVRMELNPFPDKGIPFVVAQYLPVRKSTHGEPDGALLEDNQKVLGAVTRGVIDLMAKSANGQTGIRKDMLDTTNRRKYDKGLDYEFNQNVDPRMGVFMHTYPGIPDSAQFMIQMQNMEAESLTGVKSFTQGVSGQSLGDVAAGVRGALDAASKRELGILRRLSAGMVRIGQKIVAMNAEFLSEKEVIRVTNEEFVTIHRDELAGKYDLKLSISTAEEDNNKAEQLAFLLQTMGNNMDPELSKMILSDIARLRKMPDMAQKIEDYAPKPDPMAQKKMELEIELLQAQVENERAKALQGQASAQLDQVKAQTEQVKGGLVASETDLNKLNYVEQESGVTQERDLQKAGEQARSQAQMKRMDHAAKAEQDTRNILKTYLSKTAE